MARHADKIITSMHSRAPRPSPSGPDGRRRLSSTDSRPDRRLASNLRAWWVHILAFYWLRNVHTTCYTCKILYVATVFPVLSTASCIYVYSNVTVWMNAAFHLSIVAGLSLTTGRGTDRPRGGQGCETLVWMVMWLPLCNYCRLIGRLGSSGDVDLSDSKRRDPFGAKSR